MCQQEGCLYIYLFFYYVPHDSTAPFTVIFYSEPGPENHLSNTNSEKRSNSSCCVLQFKCLIPWGAKGSDITQKRLRSESVCGGGWTVWPARGCPSMQRPWGQWLCFWHIRSSGQASWEVSLKWEKKKSSASRWAWWKGFLSIIFCRKVFLIVKLWLTIMISNMSKNTCVFYECLSSSSYRQRSSWP